MAKKSHRIADEDESVVPEPADKGVVEAPPDPPGTFPLMLYGPEGAQKVVADRAAQRKLGKGWNESPADVA